MHYGHALTSTVADCIKPPPALGILKRRKKTIRAHTARKAGPNQLSTVAEYLVQAVFKKFLTARTTDHPIYSAPLCGPSAMLYWQSCEDVRSMCYITPSVHVRAYIQN